MRLRHAMLSSALQQNATLLLLFATGVVIAHLITPREAGSYSVALAAINIVSALKDSAIGSYVVSAPELDRNLMKGAFGLSLAIAVCVAAGFYGLSFVLADFYQNSTLGQVMKIVAFAQLGPALAFPATVHLMRAMRFGNLLAIGLTAAAFQSLVSITLASLGYGAAALAWGYFASSLASAAMTICFKADALRLAPTLGGSRRLLAFGGWTSATLIVGSTAVSAPELVIGRALGLANAALFARAQNLVSFVRNGLFVGMTRPLLPRLGELEGRGLSLAPLYQRLVETITGVAWPIYALVAIWAEPLVRTIYGEAWAAAGTMMTPIAVAHALTLAVAPHYDVLIVKRRQRLLFAAELAVFLFTIAALAVGLTFGISGAVWSLVASSAFFVLCQFLAIKAAIGFAPGAMFKTWMRSLALTLAVIPAALAFRHLTGHGSVEILFGFVASGAVAAMFWCAAVALIRHELLIHIKDLLSVIPLPQTPAVSSGALSRSKETE